MSGPHPVTVIPCPAPSEAWRLPECLLLCVGGALPETQRRFNPKGWRASRLHSVREEGRP